MDFLSLSRGGKFEDAKQPKVGLGGLSVYGAERVGVHADCTWPMPAARSGGMFRTLPPIRHAVRGAGLETPIVVSGGIGTFDQAEGMLARGDADIVAGARQSLADPDWFLKIRLGRGAEVRRCVFTNYCEGLDQKHKQVTCKLWDREGLDQVGVKRTSDGRRRLEAPAWHPPPTD